MQLPGRREALHVNLGREGENEEPFKGLDVKNKLQCAIAWQRCCHPQSHTVTCWTSCIINQQFLSCDISPLGDM